MMPEHKDSQHNGQTASHNSANTVSASKRPVLVWIIAALTTLQFVAIASATLENWDLLMQEVSQGTRSPVWLLGNLLYPTVLFLGGILLWQMRKPAIYVFGLYLVWSLLKALNTHLPGMTWLSLLLAFCMLVYSLRLKRAGLLR